MRKSRLVAAFTIASVCVVGFVVPVTAAPGNVFIPSGASDAALPHVGWSKKLDCPAGFTPARTSVKQKVNMVKRTGVEFTQPSRQTKTLKKGAKTCVLLDGAPGAQVGNDNAATGGGLTATQAAKQVAVWQKSPPRTVTEIIAAGFTPDTPVSVDASIPRPGVSSAPAELGRVELVSVDNIGEQRGGMANVTSTWRYIGGSGVLATYGLNGKTGGANVKLGGVVLIQQKAWQDVRDDGRVQLNLKGMGVRADFGQSNMPSTLSRGWSQKDAPALIPNDITAPSATNADFSAGIGGWGVFIDGTGATIG